MNDVSYCSFLTFSGKLLVGKVTLGSHAAYAVEEHNHGGSDTGLLLMSHHRYVRNLSVLGWHEQALRR